MNIPEAALRGRVLLKLPTFEGTEVEVSLRLIKIPEIGAYIDAVLDSKKRLAMTVESPEDFDIYSLTDEGYETLLEADEKLNFSRALAMTKREMARADRLGKDVRAIYAEAVTLYQKYAPPSPCEAVSPETK